jgi:TP901 family phage tail tape measure protein
MAKAAPIYIPIVADDKFTKKFKKAMKTVQKAGQGMQRAGRAMTQNLTLPIIAAGAAAVKVGADYDFAMRKVEAKVKIAGKTIQDLRAQSKELGRTTVFTAREVAGAQEKMAMAGWSSIEVFQALPSVLSLSTATSHDLIETADIASNVMSTFGLKTSEAGRVSDVFATIVAGANVDMETLSETMKYAGPTAKLFGTSLEDTAAAAGFLGNMGIQGTMAGTAMARMFTNLAAPGTKAAKLLRKFNVEIEDKKTGKIRRFQDILSDMSGALSELGQAKRIAVLKEVFGQRAVKAAGPMIENVGKFDSNLKSLSATLKNIKPGKAQEMVDIMQGGATGAFQRFMSALEGVGIAFAESGLLDNAAKLADRLAGLFQKISELSPETKQLGIKIAMFAAAAGPALIVLGKLVAAVGAIGTAIAGAGGLTAVLAAVTGPVGIAVGAIAALTAATIYLWDEIEPIRTAFAEEIPRAFSISSETAEDSASAFGSLGETIKEVTKIFAPFGGVLVRIGVRFAPITLWFKSMKILLAPVIFLAKHLFRILAYGAKVLGETLSPMLEKAGRFFSKLKNYIYDLLPPVKDAINFLGQIGDKIDAFTGSLGKEATAEIGLKPESELGLDFQQMSIPSDIMAKLEAENKSEMTVRFENAPKGMSVDKSGDIFDIEADTGVIMQGGV